MKLSDEGLLFIAREEGVVLDAYKDVKGIWTIGIGHTRFAGDPIPKRGMSLSFDEAIQLFRKDIERYERRVRKFLNGVEVPQHVFDAMVSFDYNTGGIFKARWAKEAKRGNIGRASKLIMNWRKPPQIIPRRRREKSLLESGDYGDLTRIPVYRADSRGSVKWSSVTYVDPSSFFKKKKEHKETKPETIVQKPESLLERIIKILTKIFRYGKMK